MGFANESHCTEHGAGGNGLPCPWPQCPLGADTTDVFDRTGTYTRSKNITDGKVWYTWRLTMGPQLPHALPDQSPAEERFEQESAGAKPEPPLAFSRTFRW